jgi:hypothetical protein
MGRVTHLYNHQDLPPKMRPGVAIGRTIRDAQ